MCQDGSLQIWKGTGPFTRPDILVRDAHEFDSETSCIAFSLDGHTMVTRGGDSTMKSMLLVRGVRRASSS